MGSADDDVHVDRMESPNQLEFVHLVQDMHVSHHHPNADPLISIKVLPCSFISVIEVDVFSQLRDLATFRLPCVHLYWLNMSLSSHKVGKSLTICSRTVTFIYSFHGLTFHRNSTTFISRPTWKHVQQRLCSPVI